MAVANPSASSKWSPSVSDLCTHLRFIHAFLIYACIYDLYTHCWFIHTFMIYTYIYDLYIYFPFIHTFPMNPDGSIDCRNTQHIPTRSTKLFLNYESQPLPTVLDGTPVLRSSHEIIMGCIWHCVAKATRDHGSVLAWRRVCMAAWHLTLDPVSCSW